MSNLEENIKRDELIDGFFNKGWNCDLDEVYKATMGTIHDLEQANDDKIEEIERLQNVIKEVREYIMSELITDWDIKNDGHVSGSDLPVYAITPILEILDKAGDK